MVSIEEYMLELERETGFFCQDSILPRCASEYDDICCNDYPDLGIVIQGPIKYEDDFTVETVRLYRRWYPNAVIIVSTWKDEDEMVVNALRECGAIVIQSDMPAFAGICNVNRQLSSTMNGINKAIELGLKYILKTRTDQRFTVCNFIEILIHFLEIYPTDFPEYQKGRIIAPFFAPHIIGYLNDFMEFGYAEDVRNYFSVDAQVVNQQEYDISENATAILHSCFRTYSAQKMYMNAMTFDGDEGYLQLNRECIVPEVYIGKNYMTNHLHLNPTLTDYMKFVSGGMICADMKMLGLYWRKKMYGSIGKYNKGLASGLYYESMYGDWLWIFRRSGV